MKLRELSRVELVELCNNNLIHPGGTKKELVAKLESNKRFQAKLKRDAEEQEEED